MRWHQPQQPPPQIKPNQSKARNGVLHHVPSLLLLLAFAGLQQHLLMTSHSTIVVVAAVIIDSARLQSQ
jgi:hypothetical protein